MEPEKITAQDEPVAPEPLHEGSRMKIMKRVLLGFGAVALLAVGTVALAVPPRITWTPNPLVTESIAPGEKATYSVTLKNTGYLPIPATKQLRIVAEGAIAPYVTVAPPKFPTVFKRGQSVTFDVAVSVSADAPVGVSEGTLVLKRVLPNGKVKEVWRAEAMYAEFTFSPIALPPDPGEAGKVTIEGIDSDGDGVRDDVQRWIALTYPDVETLRALLTGYFIIQQRSIVDFLNLAHTPDEQKRVTRDNAKERAIWSECSFYEFGGERLAVARATKDSATALSILEAHISAQSSLRAQLLNTTERQKVYLDADVLLGGTGSGSPDNLRVACEELGFDVSSFPN
jgi:hypothetical protein